MAKKSFSAGATKPGILNSDGGEKLKEIQAKTQYNFQYIPKEKIVSNPKNEMYTQDGIEALKESIIIKLKENGCRITKQRKMILDIILEDRCSSCKEIYARVVKLDQSIGMATVYRLVKELENIGGLSREIVYK